MLSKARSLQLHRITNHTRDIFLGTIIASCLTKMCLRAPDVGVDSVEVKSMTVKSALPTFEHIGSHYTYTRPATAAVNEAGTGDQIDGNDLGTESGC